MDKFDRILRKSAEGETQSLPLDDMWNVLKKKELKKARKHRRFLQVSSMAAMLVIGLGLGIYAARSPMFSGPPYVVVPPKADASPDAISVSPPQTAEPGNVEPDSTIVEPPQANPDSTTVEPPQTNPGGTAIEPPQQNTDAAMFILLLHFDNLDHLKDTVRAKDLLPGWLPDKLVNQPLQTDDDGEYWEVINQEDQDELKIVLRMDSAASINQAIDGGVRSLPDGIRAETLPIGTGILLYYENASEGEPNEIWRIRVGENTYIQCFGINIPRPEVTYVIETLGE